MLKNSCLQSKKKKVLRWEGNCFKSFKTSVLCHILPAVSQAGREGVASSPGSDARLGLDVVEGGRTALDNKTSLLNTPSSRSFTGPRSREFAPYGYGETICTYDKSALKEAVFDDDVEQFRDCEFMW